MAIFIFVVTTCAWMGSWWYCVMQYDRLQEAFQQYKDDKNFIRLPVLHYVAPLGDVVRADADGCYVQVYDAIPARTKVMVAYDANDNAKILTREQYNKLTWIYPRPN